MPTQEQRSAAAEYHARLIHHHVRELHILVLEEANDPKVSLTERSEALSFAAELDTALKSYEKSLAEIDILKAKGQTKHANQI